MAQWYFKVGTYEIPPPDKLSYELYPQSDLIRIGDGATMMGRFLGCAEKMTLEFETILESDRYELFLNIIGHNAQNAWLVDDRALIYRIGAKVRKMDAYVGALSQDFMNNFMGIETDNWIWSNASVSFISKNATASELYVLGGGS